MINIRPITDLRYKSSDIDSYSKLVDNTGDALDEADQYAKAHKKRMTHEEVFSELRGKLNV